MSNKIKKSYIITLSATLGTALLLAVLRTVFFFTSYNENKHYFDGSFPTIVVILQFFFIFFAAIYAVCIQKKIEIDSEPKTVYNYFTSAFISTVLLTYILVSIINFGNLDVLVSSRIRLFLLASVVLALFSLPFFLSNIFNFKFKEEQQVIFGMCCIIFLVVYTLLRYMVSPLPIYSAVKSSEILSLVFIILFMVCECRIKIHRAQWAITAFVGFSAIVSSAIFSIPTIIYSLFGAEKQIDEPIYAFLVFSFLIYITVKMFDILKAKVTIEENDSNAEITDNTVYASRTELDSFNISDIELSKMDADTGDISSVPEKISEKINDGTEDIPTKSEEIIN